MASYRHRGKQERRPPKPLSQPKLEELALAYVARFATTRAKLERYLKRKLRERGWEGEGEPRPEQLAARYVELGYIDDESFARMKSSSLLRRGYGARRIGQALGEAGIEESVRNDMRPGELAQREAALFFFRRRRFGPFGAEPPDRDRREKQLAAALRAGHSLDMAREMVDAKSQDAAERWVAEAEFYEDE